MNNPDDTPPTPDSPASAPEPTFAEGQKLAGVFVLRREVRTVAGERIWLAHDEILGKDVSLHFIPELLRGDERTMSELRAEIKKNRQLIHQGILRVYDLIEENGWAAISMDWFEGESLASLLEKKGGSGFVPAEIEPWIRQICQTLDQIHKIPIVHRNLNPANFYLNGAGKLLIAKFGVSRAIEEARGRLRSRADGPDAQLVFVSPQQLDGESPNKLDDVYSLGATIFQLLTGSLPFAGDDLLAQIRRTVAPSPGQRGAQGLPAAWEKTIAACLAKDPAARPQTAGAVGHALDLGGKGGASATAAAATVAQPREQTPEPAPALREAKAKPEPVKLAEDVAAVREVSREKRKLPPAPLETAAEKRPEETDETEETYPDLGQRTGSPMTAAAVIAVLVAVIGCFVFFSRRGQPETASVSPVNKDLVAVVKPQATPVAPVATPVPAAKPPVPPNLVAANVVKPAAPAPTPAPATPAAPLLPGEPTLVDDLGPTPAVPTLAVAGSPLEHAVSTGPKNASGNNARKATPAPVKEAATPVPVAPPTAPSTAGASLASAGDLQARQTALEKAREASAAAERAFQEATKKQQSAEAALVQAQKGVDDKTKSMDPVLKAAEQLQAEQKKREDVSRTAENAAREARQAAEEQMKQADQKARQAEDAKKALTDWKMLNNEKLSARERVDTELQALKASAAEKQQAAAALAKATSDANTARQAQAALVARATQEVAAAQSAMEAEKTRQEKEAREQARLKNLREILELQLKLKQLTEQMNATDGAAPANPPVAPAPGAPVPPAPAPATPAPATPVPHASTATPLPATPPPRMALATPSPATPVPATPVPAAPSPQIALATPVPAPPAPRVPATPPPAPPLLVMNSTPAPVMPPPATPAPPTLATPAPASPAPTDSAATDKSAYENSLGIKFAPVGDVMFAIWPTRLQDFEVFAQEASVRNTSWRTPGFKQGPLHPVVNVSWIDSMAFCKWLTDKEHRKNILPKDQLYRLPTDVEWSHAVGLSEETGKTPADRDMGVPDVFPWGTQWPPPPNVGNYTGEETQSDVAIKGYDDGFQWTSPVGSFPPNKYGLYDMGGNVWQWCMDNWAPDSKSRVLRGASWYNGALKLSLLSSCRVKANPENSTDNYGFRIVRATDPAGRRKN